MNLTAAVYISSNFITEGGAQEAPPLPEGQLVVA